MRHTPLIISLAIVARITAVLFWVVPVGIFIVPVAVDRTGIFGEPHLRGNRLISVEFDELPAERIAEYRIRGALLAGGALLLIALAVCPHKLLARHALLLWPAVTISALPPISAAYALGSAILTMPPHSGGYLEDLVFAVAGFAVLEIALISLPASLVLNRILLRDRAAWASEPP